MTRAYDFFKYLLVLITLKKFAEATQINYTKNETQYNFFFLAVDRILQNIFSPNARHKAA